MAVVNSVPFGLWRRVRLQSGTVASGEAVGRTTPRRQEDADNRRWTWGSNPPGSLLIGLLDDGCPFAAAHFVKYLANGDVQHSGAGHLGPESMQEGRSRLAAAIWGETVGFRIRYRVLCAIPPSAAADRATTNGSTFIRHPAVIDEDGCYADADFKTLSSRRSHGAHVMDVFAGRTSDSSRVSPPTTVAIHRIGNPAPTLRPVPTWFSCNFQTTACVMRPAYGSKCMSSTASSTSFHLPTR